MVNRWIEHIKEYSKKNNISYSCALSLKECKDEYNNKNKTVKMEDDNNYNMDEIYLFDRKGILLFNDTSLTNLKKNIKNNYNEDIKVFLIKFIFNINNENTLKISIAPYTLTNKNKLIIDYDNPSFSIIYNKEEYEKYGFKNNHINKIIKAFRLNKISFKEGLTNNITNVLEYKKN